MDRIPSGATLQLGVRKEPKKSLRCSFFVAVDLQYGKALLLGTVPLYVSYGNKPDNQENLNGDCEWRS